MMRLFTSALLNDNASELSICSTSAKSLCFRFNSVPKLFALSSPRSKCCSAICHGHFPYTSINNGAFRCVSFLSTAKRLSITGSPPSYIRLYPCAPCFLLQPRTPLLAHCFNQRCATLALVTNQDIVLRCRYQVICIFALNFTPGTPDSVQIFFCACWCGLHFSAINAHCKSSARNNISCHLSRCRHMPAKLSVRKITVRHCNSRTANATKINGRSCFLSASAAHRYTIVVHHCPL